MPSQLSYMQLFGEDPVGRFVDVYIIHFLKDMMSSSVLDTSCRSTHQLYAGMVKTNIRLETKLLLQVDPAIRAAGTNLLISTQLYNEPLYTCSGQNILLQVHADDPIIDSRLKPGSFHEISS